jgi:hypothetical protein
MAIIFKFCRHISPLLSVWRICIMLSISASILSLNNHNLENAPSLLLKKNVQLFREWSSVNTSMYLDLASDTCCRGPLRSE